VRPAAPPHPNSAFTSRSTWHHTKSISVAKADGGYNTSDEARASSICNSASNVQDAELRRRHYLALGADLSLDKPPAAAGQDAAAATEKPLRRFFDDWPREGGDARPWTVGAEDATQLSISIPAASPSDLAAAAARYHNGESPSKKIRLLIPPGVPPFADWLGHCRA